MTFNPCSDCGGSADWAGIARLAILWFVPVVLFVLLHQLPDHHLLAPLRPVYWLSVVVAIAVTLMAESGVSSDPELSIVALPVLCAESILCVIGVLAAGYGQKRSDSASS